LKTQDTTKDKKIPSETTKPQQPKTHKQILIEQLCEGMETYEHNKTKVLLGSFTAGLELGFSYLLIAMVYTLLAGRIPPEYIPYAAAFVYPVGFIMVVMGRSILFTEQTSLLFLPVLHGKRQLKELAVLWATVIFGNLLGGIAIALIYVWVGTHIGIIDEEALKNIALHVIDFSYYTIFASAVLAGWLMALLSWLVTSSTDSISRIFMVYMITFIVGFAGLHHSIVGNIEVFTGLITSSQIKFLDYLGFQVTALFGNALGGVFFVALLRYRAFSANLNK
jgi:formate/nitrite transporter FocA (FNT family)